MTALRYDRLLERLFAMDEAAWARHASAWSVIPRIVLGLPLLLGAIWSRVLIGPWGWLALAAVIVWLWLNPRLAPRPLRTDTWWARATFGERVWLARASLPIPAHHARMAHALALSSGLGFGAALVGAALLDPLLTVAGGLIAWFAKLWFADRMVWLYQDMKSASPEYAGWERR